MANNLENFWVVGISYKNADSTLRGHFAINNEQYDSLLSCAYEFNIDEAFILSTCNRTEVYAFAANKHQIIEWLCTQCKGGMAHLETTAYAYNNINAIKHLFHVAAGLDSQILGDFEILGQIKNVVKFSKERNFIGSFMERLLNTVSQCAKAIKTNTALSCGTVSVSFAAVQYIKEHFGEIGNKNITLIGTGKIGRTTCRNIVDYLHTHNITLINRTEETASQLASELKLNFVPIEELEQQIASSDIILVSSNAPEPVITKDMLPKNGAKLLIDLSVPRNIARDVTENEGITLVDVDMLSKIKDETLSHRRAEVPKAIVIIDAHIAEFTDWCNMRKNVPIIKDVTQKLKTIPLPESLIQVYTPNTKGNNMGKDDKLQKVVNTFATRLRQSYFPGCFFINAINEYIA